jgi:hypothetical protein
MLAGEINVYLSNNYFNKAVFIFILLLTGCASNTPYHDKNPSTGNCKDSSQAICLESYYQNYPTYDFAFAEFTERGNVFNTRWIDNILQKIEAHEKERGVVVVVFVHGWLHNADEKDGNVKDFKAVLSTLANKPEFALTGRKLIGLYVGWRGASIEIPLIENVTYWDRKAVSEEVGKGGVTKLLLALEEIDKKNDSNVLVTIGHSFGGAIVVNAVSDILIDRMAQQGVVQSIGDTIIVINPAVEANQTLPLVEAAINAQYAENQSPVFISISSDADKATHYAFPLGQTMGLLFSWKQATLERDYYHDRINADDPELREEHLDTTTVGNFAPYLTHYLSSSQPSDGSPPELHLDLCQDTAEKCTPKGLTPLSGHPVISPLPDHYPFYFIKTDESIMDGHNDIFNCTMTSFLVVLVDDIMCRHYKPTRQELNAPYILNDTQKLNENIQTFYPKRAVGDCE